MTGRSFPILPLLIASLFLISGCGGLSSRQVTISSGKADTKRRIDAPFKQVPKDERVPPTQKPYKIDGKTYYPLPTSHGFTQTGIASWYGKDFHGRKTSNGETYNMWDLTAAHKTLPMNTHLLVKNLENDKELTIRVNDRGPFAKGRIIDLSKEGASRLGFIDQGTAKVQITALGESFTYQQGPVSTERFREHPDFNAGEFYVQIGSFTNEENARKLKEKVLSWGKKSVIKKFDRGDQIFYRVQVRAGQTLDAAEHVEKVMNNAGFPGAFVVAR
ncbi:MAG: septal ring lytic transglycosylase RlpA family protein [Proteobacteria bacterium]|nr:septal ring lytic transglycosylase RlpA family protein [Pseudomonadota bacterium]MBU1738317.1 septal ring lytic transglycosylase RlpA family protein [Pseudomonadota bacterium]